MCGRAWMSCSRTHGPYVRHVRVNEVAFFCRQAVFFCRDARLVRPELMLFARPMRPELVRFARLYVRNGCGLCGSCVRNWLFVRLCVRNGCGLCGSCVRNWLFVRLCVRNGCGLHGSCVRNWRGMCGRAWMSCSRTHGPCVRHVRVNEVAFFCRQAVFFCRDARLVRPELVVCTAHASGMDAVCTIIVYGCHVRGRTGRTSLQVQCHGHGCKPLWKL